MTIQKNLKNRLPNWVNEILKACPNTPKNSTYYRHIYKPKVPTLSFFDLMFGSLDETQKEEVLNKHILERLFKMLREGVDTEMEKNSLRVLCKVVKKHIPQGMEFNNGWKDTTILENNEQQLHYGVSPHKLVSSHSVGMMWDFLTMQVTGIRSNLLQIQPTEHSIFDEKNRYDESHRLSEWMNPPRRAKLYEIIRNGFDDDFQPTKSSRAFFTTLVVQSLALLLRGKELPFRSQEMSRFVKVADLDAITLRRDLGQTSEEWKLMYDYLGSGGLKNLTMNLGMKIQTSNLADMTNPKKAASPQQWRNLLIYRLMGQMPLTKVPAEVLVATSVLHKVPIHQMLVHQYDLSILLGRRMCYLPNLDRIHAYMELKEPDMAMVMDAYKEEFLAVYVNNMDKLPSSKSIWESHIKVMLSHAQLSDCTTPLQAIRRIVGEAEPMKPEDRLHGSGAAHVYIVNSLISEDGFEEEVRKDLKQSLDPDDFSQDEEEDEEDEEQIARIEKLLGHGDDTPEDEGQEFEDLPKPNAVPFQPKPSWDWDK